jgi:polynucleotide 5'-kinase involved in rRNA processing
LLCLVLIKNYFSDSSHNLIQIIDEDYRFNENLQKQISSWENFIKSGFEYSIISILGPQSGGKSTLLNYLFDTSFPQMDPSTRSQTTKGL